MINVRCDESVKASAAAVLAGLGLTVSDAVRLMLDYVAKNGKMPSDLEMNDMQYREYMSSRSDFMALNRSGSRHASEFIDNLK